MNWQDVAQKVAGFAPIVGEQLAGPAGEIAGRLVAQAVGTEATPEAVSRKFDTDPQAAIEVRKVEAELERARIAKRSEVVTAEAKGESWLARNWRPITMLSFVALIAAHWLGLTAPNLEESTVSQLLDIVQLGLGGYVIGRSAEKITRGVSGKGLMDLVKTK